MQFTRISKPANTIKVIFLRGGPWKDSGTCNVVPGRQPAAVRPNSGEPPAGTGRARAGEGPWVPRGRFPCSLGPGRGRRGGAPAARRGGRHGLLCRRGGVQWGKTAHRRVWLGAREGGEEFIWACGRPEPGLAAAAANGAGGGSATAWPGQEGRCPFLWVTREPLSDHKRPTATSRSKRRPREERTAGGGMERTCGPLGARRPDGARREEGRQDFEAASVGAWPGEGAASGRGSWLER
jgi:hypothetical protein